MHNIVDTDSSPWAADNSIIAFWNTTRYNHNRLELWLTTGCAVGDLVVGEIQHHAPEKTSGCIRNRGHRAHQWQIGVTAYKRLSISLNKMKIRPKSQHVMFRPIRLRFEPCSSCLSRSRHTRGNWRPSLQTRKTNFAELSLGVLRGHWILGFWKIPHRAEHLPDNLLHLQCCLRHSRGFPRSTAYAELGVPWNPIKCWSTSESDFIQTLMSSNLLRSQWWFGSGNGG